MAEPEPRLSLSRPDTQTVRVGLRGDWKLEGGLPSSLEVGRYLEAAGTVHRLAVDGAEIRSWDSSLLAFLVGLQNLCRGRSIEFDPAALPEGVRRLLNLAFAVPERKGARRSADRRDFLTKVGSESLKIWRQSGSMLEFLGDAVRVFGKLFVGRARFRGSDLVDIVFDCGAAALPICTLIAFLVGLILAFVGAVQLQQFGAEIYVANLVGIAMAREMGALMTAIIMAGRTGAAFAAQLGTMQVNEEIDALTTFGLSSMEFLVLPRMIALIIMMPLLCIYADLMGILGGAVVGIGMLDLSVTEYVNQTLNGIGLMDFAVGIFKSSVFGVLVALSGCLRGIQCGRSASAVGLAATSAVVTGIVFIIVTDGVFAVITNVLGSEAMATHDPDAHVTVQDLDMAYGSFVIQRNLTFTIRRGDIFIIMGGSGCGKSTLLKHLVGLMAPARGTILIGDQDLWAAAPDAQERLMRRFGILYQSGALWSSMTLAENVALPLGQFTDLKPAEIAEMASLKLALVGLAGFEGFYPSEISGGMRKRAGLARAMALDPEILFFDEPSAGLDPISSRMLDDLILELRDSLGATIAVVTHELASIFAIGNNSVFLDPDTKTMIASGDPKVLRDECPDPKVRNFLLRGGLEESAAGAGA